MGEVYYLLYLLSINNMFMRASLKTTVAGWVPSLNIIGGPSGVDANGFKRILACKSFKRSSINLCESIAALTTRRCTEFVDPLTIEPIVASRLIPLDKGNGEV